MTIRVLQVPNTGHPQTAGFKQPFTIDRLCMAFGHNLGGNQPVPDWFDGWDVVTAVRQGTAETMHMPVAALLRRRSDGTLRIVVSDHTIRGDELGADLILGPKHLAWAQDAIIDSSDNGVDDGSVKHAIRVLHSAIVADVDEPANLMVERARDDDIADAVNLRTLSAYLDRVDAAIAGLQSARRRSEAQQIAQHLRNVLRPTS